MIVLECKIAHFFGLPPRVARRKPLPLALLWLNFISQTEGLETWWPSEETSTRSASALRAHMEALREEDAAPRSRDIG